MVAVGEHVVEGDGQLFSTGITDRPFPVALNEGVRRVHPVEWLVGPAVSMDGHAAVGLDHDEPHRLGKVGAQPALVVDGAAGDHEPHGGRG